VRRAALLALLVSLLVPQTASAEFVFKWKRSGDVLAALSYEVRNDVYRNVRLRIERAGSTVLTARIATDCPGCPLAGPTSAPLSVRDLDADLEPEVLVDLFSGGAHCCLSTFLYRFRPDTGSYVRTRANWGNAGYRLTDLDRDGTPEFSSADDRFAYAFTAYAFSVDPIRIWRFERGRLLDVTRDFPRLVARDAARTLALYRRTHRRRDAEVRGVLAAYVADQYLLGRPMVGWRLVNAALRRGELGRGRTKLGYPAGSRYVVALRRFLRRTGYVR
jgi:hypothetical protein